MENHGDAVAQRFGLAASTHERFQRELRGISTELQHYTETTKKLLNFSEDIRSMYDDILKFRGQELLHDNGVRLAQIAQADSVENKTMLSLADKTAQDSRTMRIATLIAMVYLPANLVMAFFSTVFVWFDSAGDGEEEESQASHLQVHSSIWISVVTILVLTTCTLTASMWWERKEKARTDKDDSKEKRFSNVHSLSEGMV
ncbi:hypothetical protein PFICI_00811 [Pestalotiopsis fici W106-1]|uniref:Uncharacterized protein n=1 Tax=Pestalotiopsis fici (strain W106-1 / CGMCC3.15140) TaxID=1229662 RepID=W3XLP3_PESFW|nr:uncharacterized protein PFICI_00811 [Pestalotiopsis fici W106-1]ETS86983.1 hypothetical protein PFICI_00811 [Pestalotiopsis fici W106-1]